MRHHSPSTMHATRPIITDTKSALELCDRMLADCEQLMTDVRATKIREHYGFGTWLLRGLTGKGWETAKD